MQDQGKTIDLAIETFRAISHWGLDLMRAGNTRSVLGKRSLFFTPENERRADINKKRKNRVRAKLAKASRKRNRIP
ncbi:MAG: hypothetical protein AB7U75_22000 [Hyphomicrobiaceae bacterium]